MNKPFSASAYSETVKDLPASLLSAEMDRTVDTTDFIQKQKREMIRLELKRRSKIPPQWAITKDCIADLSAKPGTNSNAIGLIGPGTATLTYAEILKNPDGHKFRMRDDDDVVYYEGIFIGDHTSEDAFLPLDDFGTPNAGCTLIEYKEGNTWSAL
jgi:hypothetical protein